MNWNQLKAISAVGTLSVAMLASGVAQQSTQPQGSTQNPPAPSAEKNPHANKMHEKRTGMERGMENLNLTDEQKTQIQKIHGNARHRMRAVQNDTSLTDAQKKDKMRAIHRATHKRVMAVLTSEQREQYQKNRSEHRHPMKGKGEKTPEQPKS